MSVANSVFRSPLTHTIFNQKYRHEGCETWDLLATTLVRDVCVGLLPKDTCDSIMRLIAEMKFIPGGRYLYYAGRPVKYWNNCYLLRAEEDTRQDWAMMSWKAEGCLMTGGGIGADYSIYRCEGSKLGRTGGVASGPIPKIEMIDSIGCKVMQGGSRRSALYASLKWSHGDANKFLTVKDWSRYPVGNTGLTIADIRKQDYNFPAPLSMTNISLNYDTAWLDHYAETGDPGDIFRKNVRQAMMTGEPGFSFNFGTQELETLRNACTEVCSSDDSDVCNLGSLNMGRLTTLAEFRDAVHLATLFLLCGTIRADVPYDKVAQVRQKNRRLGLGLMGVHEWLMQRGYRYEVVPELREWLGFYRYEADAAAFSGANTLSVSRPIATRAIAPTGTIGIMAATTPGIEPLFSVAYKRRYLKGKEWHYQYVVDATAETLIKLHDIDSEKIESAVDLASDYERRIKFQADVQDYVDQAISSTINLPAWGTDLNNEDKVPEMACVLAKYAPRLRGITAYPDGGRGGQPLTVVPYAFAKSKGPAECREEAHDVCLITNRGGTCGA
jgi:ribonucleoside-diphosphate reductase alpha chain